MSEHKNESRSQIIASWLVDNKIWTDFYETFKETLKHGSSLQHLVIYTIFTTDTKHWPNFCPKNENVRHLFFLLFSLKVKTLQLRSIVYIISMRVQKKPHSWLLNRKSFWFIERTRLYLLKQSMTWLDLNHDFFKMKIFNPFIIFHHS